MISKFQRKAKKVAETTARTAARRNISTSVMIEEAIDRQYQLHPNFISLEAHRITEIPDQIYKCENVFTIYLSNNLLREIPSQLLRMPSLRKIVLTGNPIETLPEDLKITVTIDIKTYFRCYAKQATDYIEVAVPLNTSEHDIELFIDEMNCGKGSRRIELGTRGVSLKEMNQPPSTAMQKLLGALGNFKNIQSLKIRSMALQNVPEGIRELKSLSELYLDGLALVELPEWLGTLPLDSISAISNKITKLPQGFSRLNNITAINLSWNPLTEIPRVIFDFRNLENLAVYECSITEVPADILRLPHLKYLNIRGNSIISPPPEVVGKGPEAIRGYWRQRRDTGVDYLAEAKVIILGEGGAGKTSLAYKILNKHYQLNESQKSTEGIDVLRYSFPTSIRRRASGDKKPLERDFQVNIWDFGGQEIYHATHQFFLTRRSVYVLVCDNRAEDTDFSYWLNIVKMLSDSSPLLIVQNEKHDRSRPIDKTTLGREFENLSNVLPTNLQDNRGLEEVVNAIQAELERLPHVGVGLPVTWKRVREALENDKRDYITLTDYLNICEQHGFKEQKDKLQLSEYLHDLGIFLHFQQDAILKHYVILNPSWGTDAVYRVLDDKEVIATQGRFTVQQLNDIWSEDKYEGMHQELVQLMTKFQLCYKLDNYEAYIAPQLLPLERPAYTWPESGNAVLRYEYDFMPKGIITRFIVAQHRRIHQELVWKTGVVLYEAGTQAEVVEEYARRRVTVRVTGPDCRGLLAIVNDQFERIHESFHQLTYERYLPCPCVKCQNQTEPRRFSINDLMNVAREGRSIQCYGSMEMVDAVSLLRNILPSALVKEDLCIDSEPIVDGESIEILHAQEIYVSYARAAESEAFVDQLANALKDKGITLLIDKNEIKYKDSIRKFMQRIGQGNCVIVIISEKYLKSQYCMYELLEVERNAGLRKRIFPIVLRDADIYDPVVLVDYIKHWEDQYEALDRKLKGLKGHGLETLHETLNKYEEIRRLFSNIVSLLSDMNTLSSEQHLESGFKDLIIALRAQIVG